MIKENGLSVQYSSITTTIVPHQGDPTDSATAAAASTSLPNTSEPWTTSIEREIGEEKATSNVVTRRQNEGERRILAPYRERRSPSLNQGCFRLSARVRPIIAVQEPFPPLPIWHLGQTEVRLLPPLFPIYESAKIMNINLFQAPVCVPPS